MKYFISVWFVLLFMHNGRSQLNIDSAWNASKDLFIKKDYSNTIKLCEKVIANTNNESLLLNCNLLIGDSYLKLNQPSKAIDFLNNCAQYKKNNELDMYYLLSLGDAYIGTKQYIKAIKNYEKAYNKTHSPNNDLASIAKDIANAYNLINNEKKAIDWYKKALNHFSEEKNLSEELNTHILIAKLYGNYGDYNNSELYFKNSLTLAKSLKKNDLIKSIESDIKLLEKKQQTGESLKTSYIKEKETETELLISNILRKEAKSLHEIEQLSEEKQLVEYKIKVQADLYEKKILKDKLKLLEKEKSLNEAKVKLEKEKIISEKKSFQLVASLIFGLLLLILITTLYFLYKSKIKTNEMLLQKNKEISSQKKQIDDSINYSKNIQKAFLPNLNLFLNKYPNSFVFHSPKDKVSGDFLWFKEVGDFLYVAVADCTGHGVPGALMSIVCNEILDASIDFKNEISPDDILQKILMSFSKRLTNDSEFIGGMDISLIQIDKKNKIVKHAGARNSAIIITQNKLQEYKGSRFSIGYKEVGNSKTNINLNTFTITPGSFLYLFSDGFPDQKGGEYGKKYFMENFRNFLLQIHSLPINKQQEQINVELNKWKMNFPQGDDIFIFGLDLNFF